MMPAVLKERPFFLVGFPRSGTSLLRFMLNGHPRLFLPEETGFIPFLNQDPERKLTQAEVGAVLTRIGRLNRYWQDMVTDLGTFYDGLAEPRMAHILDALYRQKMTPYGGQRWGDKTPGYLRYLTQIDLIFPDAQFIHIIRDGRDTTLSALQKWGDKNRYMDSYYLIKNWSREVGKCRLAGQPLGTKRYLEVHYESLVQEPEKTMRLICAFLDEEFVSEVLDPSHFSLNYHGPDVTENLKRPVSTKSVWRWRRQMSAYEQKMADKVAGQLLTTLGYEQAALEPFTFWERVRMVYAGFRYGLLDMTRRTLYASGLMSLNRGRRGR